MNKENLKMIIFDMDGVILDSEPLHENARQMIFRRLGIIPDESFPDPVGKSSSGFWNAVLQQSEAKGDPNELEEEQYDLVAKQIREDHIPPSEGLMDVIEWAKKKGVKIGLASSSTRGLVNDTLRLLGVDGYFDYTVSGDEADRKKPAPDVYLKVLALSGIPAGAAAAVEDSRAGVEAARKAGIFCCGYKNETSGSQDISGADAVIDHLKEVTAVLRD